MNLWSDPSTPSLPHPQLISSLLLSQSRVEDPWEYSVDFRNYEWHPSKQKKSETLSTRPSPLPLPLLTRPLLSLPLLTRPLAFVRRRKLRRLVGDSRLHEVTSQPQGISSFSSSSTSDRLVNPPPPTVKGVILKSGGKLQAFNDRYFVLESHPPPPPPSSGISAEGTPARAGVGGSSYLIYYLKYTDSPPYGNNERDRMDLKNCQMSSTAEGHVVLTSKKGKTYILDLQDHPDQDKWIHSLRDHISYANGDTLSK
jgi:hypothetical protein